MSDQSPPPKPKPGSLRDRIAAFENKGSTAPAVPPPTRPKPVQWKPKPPSPPTSPDNVQSADRKPASTGGMSASDALESIGRAGSLKERMAALQGKGGFGGPPPPVAPKPNVDRPKWKPPPAVPAPVTSDDEPTVGRAASRSPPPRAVASPSPETQEASHRDADPIQQEGDDGDVDPEEEERQRRAAIAARMARLGGARFGMAPPIFAPKPVVRKPEPAPEVKDDEPITVKESSQGAIIDNTLSMIADNVLFIVSVTSPPPDLPAAVSPIPKVVTETGMCATSWLGIGSKSIPQGTRMNPNHPRLYLRALPLRCPCLQVHAGPHPHARNHPRMYPRRHYPSLPSKMTV